MATIANIGEIKTRIDGNGSSNPGMTDLSEGTFNAVFADYDSTVAGLSEDDVYNEIKTKIVELFENEAKGKSATAVATIISDVKTRLSATGRLTTKGSAIETELNNIFARVDEISNDINGLGTNFSEQAVRDLLTKIGAVSSANARQSFYRDILTLCKEKHFSMEPESADAVTTGQNFWNFVNGEIGARGDSLNSVVSHGDYGTEVGQAWTNVQNGHVGAYKDLLDEITSLESSLGAFDTEAKIDAEIARLDTDEVTNIDNAHRLGIFDDMNQIVDSYGIDSFIAVASDAELDEFKADLADAITKEPIASDPARVSKYTDAINSINAAGSGRTAKSVDDIKNDIEEPSTGLQKKFDDADAEYNDAELEVKKAEFKNANFSVSLGELRHLASTASDWEKTLLEEEIDRREHAGYNQANMDTTLLQSTYDTILNDAGLTGPIDVENERVSRETLNRYICEEISSKLWTIDAGGVAQLHDDFRNQIMTDFGPKASDVIGFVETEIRGRVAAINRGEWYAKYSSVELAGILSGKIQPYGAGNPFPGAPLTPAEERDIQATIDARKELLDKWFVKDNGFLNSHYLDVVEKMQKEFIARKVDDLELDRLRSERDTKRGVRNTAKDNLDAAEKQKQSREYFNNYVQKKTARADALASNTAKRDELDTNKRADAQKLKLSRETKAAYDQILSEAEAHYSGQDKVEQTDIENFVNGHASLAVLNTHPKAADLKAQLIAEIGRRVNKVKPVSHSVSKPSIWARGIAGAVGLVTGLGLSCVPGIQTITLGVTAARFIYKGVKWVGSKIINAHTTKHPTGKIANFCNKVSTFVNGNSGIAKAIRGVRKFMSDSRTQWFLNGVSMGLVAGNLIEHFTHKNVAEHLFGSGDKTTASVPGTGTGGDPLMSGAPANWPADVDYEFWSNYTTGDALNFEGLRGFNDSYAARGMYQTAAENASLHINQARAAFSEGTFGYSFKLPDNTTFTGSFKELIDRGIDFSKCAVRGQNNGGDLAWYNLLDVMKNGANVVKTGGFTR